MTDRTRSLVGLIFWAFWGAAITAAVAFLWTNFREMQIAAHRLEARANTILNVLPVAIVVCDENGKIVLVSHESEDVLGWPADALVGNPITAAMDEATAIKHQEGWDKTVAKIRKLGPRYVFDRTMSVEGYSQDGKKMHWRIHMRALMLDDGQVEFVSAIVKQRPQSGIKPLEIDPGEPPAMEQST